MFHSGATNSVSVSYDGMALVSLATLLFPHGNMPDATSRQEVYGPYINVCGSAELCRDAYLNRVWKEAPAQQYF